MGPLVRRMLMLSMLLVPAFAAAQAEVCRVPDDGPAQCVHASLDACEAARTTLGGTCRVAPAEAGSAAPSAPAGGTPYDFGKPSARHDSGGALADTFARGSRQRQAAYEANVATIREQVARIRRERDGAGPAAAPPVAPPAADPERYRCRSPQGAISYAAAPIAGYACEDLAPPMPATRGDDAAPRE